MVNFENLDALKNFLQNDYGKKTSEPVRFVNVESLADWFEMKNFLSTLVADFIFLSDFCASEDTLPNLRKLRDDLKKKSRSVFVVPLAELLRVNPERAAQEINFFLNLFRGEIFSFRIYFLMYRMKKFFLSLKISDPRKKFCVLLTSSEAVDDYSLTMIQKSERLNFSGEGVDGFKKYLEHWEKTPGAATFLFTENAVYFQDKKFFDNVTVIANAFDLLRRRYDLPAELKKFFGREENWQRLAESVVAAGNFEQAFCKEFKVDGFSLILLKNFGDLENFRQWFLWLRCKLQGDNYLARCAKTSDSTEEFVAQIYRLIFSFAEEKFFDNFCDERREILSLMKILPPENFIEQVRQADKKIALKILTCNSQAERLMIFETLQRFKFNEASSAQKILQRTFPALANYLSEGVTAFTEEQAEYFSRYRWLKVTNRLTKNFYLKVTELAQNAGRNIFSLKSRNEIVGEEYSDVAAIFFVDGLGAEYINFFAEEFASLEKIFFVKYRVGRCNLPSVTELNKDFLQERNVAGEVLDLDTLKHENRTYPENILGELEILSSLKEKIRRALNVHEKIILCADHGTSRLAVLARQSEFDTAYPAENQRVYKSGRFADALPNDTKNFPTALEYDGKIIFADYSRFTQKGAPGNEIHGGAALEEVLVPVIAIERRKNFFERTKFQRR